MKLSAPLTHDRDRPPPPNQEGDRPLGEDIPVERGTSTLRAIVPYCLAILAVAPSILHFAVVGQRFQESWLFGVVTLIAAWLQLLWALAVLIQPSRIVWWRVGAILNAAIIVADIATRMMGGASGFGLAAGIVFAALVVLGCAWLLFGDQDLRVGRDGVVGAYGVLGIGTAAILSISLVAGGPALTTSAGASVPAVDRHGLQADVPLPAGVSFAGVRQTTRMPDMQYHTNISIDTWGWTVSGRGPLAVQNFYEATLAKHGWTHIQGQSVMDKVGNHGRCDVTKGCEAAKHLTACQSGQVLLMSTSGTTLNVADAGGKSTAAVTAPRGGAALLIQIDRSPQAAQVACANAR